VIGFLRFIGVMNASIWFGSAIFFTFLAQPAFLSPEMLRLFGGAASPLARWYGAEAALVVLERYYLLHQWCGAIALFHLLVEWLYAGKAVTKFMLWLLVGTFGLGLAGGYWLQPKMAELHYKVHAGRYAAPERKKAEDSFRIVHAVAQTANFLVTAGLLLYVWNVTNPPSAPRFASRTKFRS